MLKVRYTYCTQVLLCPCSVFRFPPTSSPRLHFNYINCVSLGKIKPKDRLDKAVHFHQDTAQGRNVSSA